MANQGPNSLSGQTQLRRDDNQPSNTQNQTDSFLQNTGDQVKNMAQGATEIGKGAVNIARGAVTGAANMAQGAAETVKNTIGINNASAPNVPSNHNDNMRPATTANPSDHPINITNPGTNPRI